jgi:hypothetical protein
MHGSTWVCTYYSMFRDWEWEESRVNNQGAISIPRILIKGAAMDHWHMESTYSPETYTSMPIALFNAVSFNLLPTGVSWSLHLSFGSFYRALLAC